MVENTGLKDLQAEMKKMNEYIEESRGRFQNMDRRLDQMGSLLQTVAKSLDQMNQRFKQLQITNAGVSLPSNPSPGNAIATVTPFILVKLDFPRFDGKDALDWLFKADQYFEYYDITDLQRLVIVVVHLDGEVLPWFQMLEKAG